ncbi:MAG: aminotransferase class I/II-fold pyridoxal phosphate-dependent enzyme [Ruminococcus sp.]|nr:aminotransferase class I/II-fold pyridoxal phosphate-dependent enzyme [Ruminococcus sp.]MBQ9516416.1 aminotransferase class I/II-fold pyridoxal phosphate-dependent enzyme [Ruminococcus sp.]
MKYDFTTIMDRSGKNALAVDSIGADVSWAQAPTAPRDGFSKIPMWVADMNFATVPTIPQAIIKRAEHPAYGYYIPTKEYYESIIRWHEKRNGVTGLTAKDIGYENGVLGCVSSAIQAFTSPGEKILLHSPTYIGFTHVLEDTGRVAELSPLKKDENGVWRMDYEDMDARLKKNHIHLTILCSPHNPCGRVWEREELELAMEIFKKNHCIVISDEIWSDILLNGHKHIPTQSISEDAKNRTIAVYAPSKTFNLAGLIGSYHIIYDEYLHDRVRRQSAMSHYNSMNVLSMHALIGAYMDEGHQWVDELNQVLSQNINDAYDVIINNFDGVDVSKPEGTYMLFLHCEEYCKKHGITIDELIQRGWDVGVAWQQGEPFHDPWGIRMNLALPHSLVMEAMNRLKQYVFKV